MPEDLNALCVALLQKAPGDRPSGSEILQLVRYQEPGEKEKYKSHSPDTIPFTGRDDELAALHLAFDKVRKAGTQAILIRGPSGIGKTTLVQEWIQRIEQEVSDLVFLAGRCYERESVRYRAMDGVIDELSHYWKKLPEPQS